MTQEEKELLIKDICARLQSGLICSIYREDDEGFGWRDAECKGYFKNKDNYEFYFEDIITIDNIERLKPYLIPFSSMTEEEKSIYLSYCECDDGDYIGETIYFNTIESFDYLNQIHIDYRNLIPKGLAIEAPENMYNTKTE